MAEQHQLENKMRMLKLSGMVDTLNMRLDQAQKEGLSLSQFLEILLEDEVLAPRLTRDWLPGLAGPVLKKRRT